MTVVIHNAVIAGTLRGDSAVVIDNARLTATGPDSWFCHDCQTNFTGTSHRCRGVGMHAKDPTVQQRLSPRCTARGPQNAWCFLPAEHDASHDAYLPGTLSRVHWR